MRVAARHEFRMAMPPLGGLQNELEGQIKDMVRGNALMPKADAEPAREAGSAAKRLVERISAASIEEIDQALAQLGNMRTAVLEHNERIRMEIATYESANQKAALSLRGVSEILAHWKEKGAAAEAHSDAAE